MISLSDLSEKELKEYQTKLFKILCCFDKVCSENNLQYFLVEGTCLGAIRHRGFIPWDDDVDVAMPRPDYETLWSIWNEKYSDTGLVLLRTTEEQCIRFHIMQLRDARTTCIYPHSTDLDICHGIKIDICPLDGVPKSKIKQRIQLFNTKIFGLFSAQRIPNQEGGRITKLIARILLFIFRSRRVRYKLWSKAEKRFTKYEYATSEYVRCLNSSPIKKSILEPPFLVQFESEMFPVPNCYDEYLKMLYGDYMTPPPPEKRKPYRTVLVKFDLNRSYLDYKGIFYLRDKEQQ